MTTAARKRRKVNPHALHALRMKADLTQERLGSLARIDHTTISRLERGERFTCPVEVIERLAEALHVPTNALCAAD